MKRRLSAIIIAVVMMVSLFSANSLAAVSQEDIPDDLAGNLVIGILNDSRAENAGEFPNEPSVTGYD